MGAGEFLKQCKQFVEEGVHPRIIIRSFRKATTMAINRIQELAVTVSKENKQEHRALLEKCAATSMSSKLIHQQSEMFAKMVVDAVTMLDDLMPLNMIGIKKVQGGSLEETELVPGVAFKKTFSYAGFDATNILNKLRQKHAQNGGLWYGVDVINEDIADNFSACVWEPSIVKINAITAASEATCLLLSVDETVKNPRSGQGDGGMQMPGGMGRGRGRPM